MQIEGSFAFKAPREMIFQRMTDPECLNAAVPGCERLVSVGENEYEMTLKIGIAAVKGTYAGKIRIDEMVVPEAYRMIVEGNSGPGNIKGVGQIRLVEEGNGTKVLYSGDVQVFGKIAAVGNRFLGMTAKMMVGKFFSEMAKQVDKL